MTVSYERKRRLHNGYLLAAGSQRRPPNKSMIIVSDQGLFVSGVFRVKCTERVPCPCCHGDLKVIGSRRRIGKRLDGSTRVFILRRLRCIHCRRIHHELPSCLVPYKHYESECVEAALSDGSKETAMVPADDSTIVRWHRWAAALVTYWLGCLEAIALRLGRAALVVSRPSRSVHMRLGRVVGEAAGWLRRVVRPITNAHLWVHTRFA